MNSCGAASHRMSMRFSAQRHAIRCIVLISNAEEAAMAVDIHDAREDRQLPVPQSPETPAPNLPKRLHPAIYFVIVALAAVFVASAATFAAGDDSYYLIAIACIFICLAMFLPFQLWRVRRHGHDRRDTSLSHRRLAAGSMPSSTSGRPASAARMPPWQSCCRLRPSRSECSVSPSFCISTSASRQLDSAAPAR